MFYINLDGACRYLNSLMCNEHSWKMVSDDAHLSCCMVIM